MHTSPRIRARSLLALSVTTESQLGFERRQRGNARGVDLNRNFPDQFDSPNKIYVFEPEVEVRNLGDCVYDMLFGIFFLAGDQSILLYPFALSLKKAMMNWTLSHRFVQSINFHGGAVVANYPFDGNREACPRACHVIQDSISFHCLLHLYSTI